MIKVNRLTAAVLIAGVCGASGIAQDRMERDRSGQVPAAGFWPTPRMIEFGINRMTEEMGKVYDLTDDQVWLTREVIKSKFPAWMQANRAEMQTLMNEYFEALIADEAPAPEDVAVWANRVLPLFEEFNVLMEETADEFRTFMTDEQIVTLNGQMAAMRVGMNMARDRMQVWSEGGYDPRTEWVRNPEFREREREQRQQLERDQRYAQLMAEGVPQEEAHQRVYGDTAAAAAAAAEEAGTTDARPRTAAAAAGAKDDWDKYVEEFIQRYELDQSQATRAVHFLTDAKKSRDAYLRTKADDIQRLQERLAAADSGEARERIGKDLEKIKEPIEKYFDRMKQRLEGLPTRAQRAKAEEAQKTREAAATSGREGRSGGRGR